MDWDVLRVHLDKLFVDRTPRDAMPSDAMPSPYFVRFVFGLPATVQAALSLQAAAQQFLAERRKRVKPVQHVVLRSSCEIMPDCQNILKHTFPGHCNYPDINQVDFTSGHVNWCSTHQRMCKELVSKDPYRTSTTYY